MAKATRIAPSTAPLHGAPVTGRSQPLGDRWDQEMTRLLREAAEVREQRARVRAEEDDRSSRRESAALLELVRAHGRPRA